MFNKIRIKLIDANKVKKYFLYAIGEIVLVVIGILIALQINAVNDEKKKRIKEATLLKELHKDFLKNKNQFDKVKIDHVNAFKAAQNMMKYLPTNNDNKRMLKVGELLSASVRVPTFNPSNSTVESIINSSSFNVIQNDTLRAYLISWKDVLLDYQEEENNAFKFIQTQLNPYFVENSDMIERGNKMNITMVSSVKFQNLMTLNLLHQMYIVNAIKNEPIEKTLTEIIRLTKLK